MLSRLRAWCGALDGLKAQPQSQGAGDLQEGCQGGVAVFRERGVEVAAV